MKDIAERENARKDAQKESDAARARADKVSYKPEVIDIVILMMQWREEIRADLIQIVPPEPDAGDPSTLKIRLKFPDGKLVSRCFSQNSSVKVRP